MGLITLWMEKHNVGAHGDEFDFSIVERMLIAGRAAWFYFGKLVWPYPLAFFYPRFTIDDHAIWQYAFPIAAVAAIAALWWWRAQNRPRPTGGRVDLWRGARAGARLLQRLSISLFLRG